MYRADLRYRFHSSIINILFAWSEFWAQKDCEKHFFQRKVFKENLKEDSVNLKNNIGFLLNFLLLVENSLIC